MERERRVKRIIGHGALIVFIALYTTVASAEYERVHIPLKGSPSRGPANAKVTIVEFLDYQ
jgi:hypothetical protein